VYFANDPIILDVKILLRILTVFYRTRVTPIRRVLFPLLFLYLCVYNSALLANDHNGLSNWRQLADAGNYDEAAVSALTDNQDGRLKLLINRARVRGLSEQSQWRAFIHYKPTFARGWLSQVDSPHFFLSNDGKQSPESELNATLAALFSTSAKAPLRLSAYCRFVARRIWLSEQLPEFNELVPAQPCPEFEQYRSPSSAFGHTLLRIDKKDQAEDARLLNMSLNFAADVPPDSGSASYAIKGLAGGFEGRFRLLPYHIKLREYGQIENRDTWEYELNLEQEAVDLIVRHAYEMLISHFDYYFLSENCSYHLLSLLEVAFPDDPITDSFNYWTIPIDTIRKLDEIGLASTPRFVPSSIRKLRASAQGTTRREKLVLSKRSKLGLTSVSTEVPEPLTPPHVGHGTSRLGLDYQYQNSGASLIRLHFRPAYHDFKDPSAGFGDNAAIELGLISAAYNRERDDLFIDQFTLINIESLEPIGQFFRPISWRTGIQWIRPNSEDAIRFKWNVGAGMAIRPNAGNTVLYLFGEADIVHDRSLDDQTQLRVGPSIGIHWLIKPDFKLGLESHFRQQLGGDSYEAYTEAWGGYALTSQLSLNIEASIGKQEAEESTTRLMAGIRTFF